MPKNDLAKFNCPKLDGSWMLDGTHFFDGWRIFEKATPLSSCQVHGLAFKEYIFEVHSGTQYVRRADPYTMSPKTYLSRWQESFSAGIAAWQSLDAETKALLDARASKLGLQYPGYNYFLHLWLRALPELALYWPV